MEWQNLTAKNDVSIKYSSFVPQFLQLSEVDVCPSMHWTYRAILQNCMENHVVTGAGVGTFDNLYLPLPTAWYQWHSNMNQLGLFKPQFSTFGETQVWKQSPKFWLREQELQGTLFAGSEAHENLPLPFSPHPQAQSPSLGDQPSTSSALFSLDSRRNQLSRNSNLIHSTMKVFDF